MRWLSLCFLLLVTVSDAEAGRTDVPWWLPGCYEEWEAYTTFDSVFMQRDNLANPHQTLIADSTTGAPVINAQG